MADYRTRFNNCSRADSDAIADFGVRSNGCAGVYAELVISFRKQPGRSTRERQFGIRCDDYSFQWPISGSHNDARRLAQLRFSVKFFLCVAEIAGSRVL
jgi:hypothetical protein